jgi:hypothetical protein
MVAVLLAVSAPAFAQLQPVQRAQQRETSQRVTQLDFGEGDLISAEAEGPDYQVFDTRPEVEHSSLIRVRKDFDEKVLKSADALESAAVR